MPPSVNDDLYKLIHSLSRTERGYVRKYWSRYSNDAALDYIELFDILSDMPTYQQAELKRRIADRSWSARLSQTKNYCMARLLEALRAYTSSTTPSRQITELLDDADILWNRLLYSSALKKAEKARQLAELFDEFALHLRALSWLKRYRRIVLEAPVIDSDKDQLSVEQHQVFERYQNSISYEGLGNALHHHLIQSTKGDAESRRWLDELLQHPLLASSATALSHSAKVNYYLARCAWHRLHNSNIEGALTEATALFKLKNDNPECFGARPYVGDQIDYVYLDCCLEAGHNDQFLEVIDTYWKPSSTELHPTDTMQHMYRLWALELSYATNSKDGARILKHHERFQTFYVEYADVIPPHSRVTNIFSMLRICINANQQTHAAFWMQQMLLQPTDVRPDLHAASTLIELMTAVDNNDKTFVRNRTRAFERYVKKHLTGSAELTIVLSYFRRWPDATPTQARSLKLQSNVRLQELPRAHAFDPVTQSGALEWFNS